VALTVRPVETHEDREANLAVWNAVIPQRLFGLAELLDYEDRLEHSIVLVAEDEGRVVGGAHGGLEAGSAHPSGSVYVLPEHRRIGAGTALYRAVSEWARSIEADRLYGDVEESDPESLDWALRRGFVERSRDSRLVLDLDGIEPPAVVSPEGIEIVTWAERPELIDGIYEVYAEASPDIPGEEDEPIAPYAEWRRQHMGGSADKPEATFVALAGDEVVGYSKFHLTEAQPDVAFHDLTAVKGAWRGRGIAGALKATQIRWAKERGYARLSTMNEERNEPIRRLNERYGYRLEPGRVFIVGPLSP
jgi:mycothiol synthase